MKTTSNFPNFQNFDLKTYLCYYTRLSYLRQGTVFLIRKPNSVNDFKRPVYSLSVAFFYFPFTLNHNTILCYKTNNARFNEFG